MRARSHGKTEQETAGSTRIPLYDKTDIVIVCFSVVSRSSFDNVSKWVQEVNNVRAELEKQNKKKNKAPPLKLIIAGLKTDLMGVSGGLVKSAELAVCVALLQSL